MNTTEKSNKTPKQAIDTYWDRTSRPIYAFVYLFVFIVIYEAGLFMLNTDVFTLPMGQVPGVVVSFAWVYTALLKVGFNSYGAWIGAPVVVIVTLIVWQLASNKKPQVLVTDFLPMTLECIAWSLPLILFSVFISNILSPDSHVAVPAIPQAALLNAAPDFQNFLVSVIAGIGAGIYEELFFRLYLMMMLVLIMRKFLGMPEIRANCFAIIISALLFSLHHHIYFLNGSLQTGEPFVLGAFIFRFVAGVYLAVLFGLRGFGVVAATHAYHNIITAVINYI